jgi:hypothetical protein
MTRPSCVFSGGEKRRWIDDIEKMMWDLGTLREARLGCTDLKFAVHRHRIAIHDFTLKSFCEGEGKCSFSAGGGTEDNDQQRVGRQRRFQWIACQKRASVMASSVAAMINRPVVSIA